MKRLVKTFSIAASVATASVLLSSCATIVTGGAPKITIYGDVPEPVTIETEDGAYKNDQGTVLRSFVAEGHKKRGRCSRMVLFSNRFTKPNIYKIQTFRLSSSSERYRAVAHARGRANGGDGCRLLWRLSNGKK